MFRFDVHQAGDSALHVQLPERIDPLESAWCIRLARAIEGQLGAAVRDVVVGYCSVTAYFEPLLTDATWLEHRICEMAESIGEVQDSPGGVINVPVCYGGEYGPDIADVARFGGCSEREVIAIHTGAIYRVYLVGFVPGFPYLAEVDRRIAAPRRPTPRISVPPGSVAIAGGQTGIYPSATPGGWNIIGRTPVAPYDPARTEPFLFRPGNSVRFFAISAEELAAAS